MTHKPVNLGTLAGILEAERKMRSMFGQGAYQNCDGTLIRLREMQDRATAGGLCVLLNALKDQCLALSMSTVAPEESK